MVTSKSMTLKTKALAKGDHPVHAACKHDDTTLKTKAIAKPVHTARKRFISPEEEVEPQEEDEFQAEDEPQAEDEQEPQADDEQELQAEDDEKDDEMDKDDSHYVEDKNVSLFIHLVSQAYDAYFAIHLARVFSES